METRYDTHMLHHPPPGSICLPDNVKAIQCASNVHVHVHVHWLECESDAHLVNASVKGSLVLTCTACMANTQFPPVCFLSFHLPICLSVCLLIFSSICFSFCLKIREGALNRLSTIIATFVGLFYLVTAAAIIVRLQFMYSICLVIGLLPALGCVCCHSGVGLESAKATTRCTFFSCLPPALPPPPLLASLVQQIDARGKKQIKKLIVRASIFILIYLFCGLPSEGIALYSP